jgi:hypothetical protein
MGAGGRWGHVVWGRRAAGIERLALRGPEEEEQVAGLSDLAQLLGPLDEGGRGGVGGTLVGVVVT